MLGFSLLVCTYILHYWVYSKDIFDNMKTCYKLCDKIDVASCDQLSTCHVVLFLTKESIYKEVNGEREREK